MVRTTGRLEKSRVRKIGIPQSKVKGKFRKELRKKTSVAR